MSQREFLQEFDAMAAEAFLDAGLADVAVLTPASGGLPMACTVMVDREAQFYGDVAEVAGRRVLVTLFFAEVPAPARGDVLQVGPDVWRLDALEDADESRSRWVVTRG